MYRIIASSLKGVTRKALPSGELILQTGVAHNFRRLFNLNTCNGTRKCDRIGYRAMSPVTRDEYESQERCCHQQLKELVGFDPEGKSTEEENEYLGGEK